jgi:hypothetical protein
MGESSDAEAAPLRSSVVSLTNGPSIMILGRLGVFSTRYRGARPDSHRPRDPLIVMITLASTIGIYLGTSRRPGSLPWYGQQPE